jgi:hypothetical protein
MFNSLHEENEWFFSSDKRRFVFYKSVIFYIIFTTEYISSSFSNKYFSSQF